ncbi:MAG: hypothetical protein AAF726_01275, partial [Planctomycetota bacterium]
MIQRRPARALTVTLALMAGAALLAPLGLSASSGLDDHVDDEQASDLVLSARRVIVRPGEVLEDAKVLVRDGRIVQVGADVKVPEGAEVLEGEVVCAGFIDAWSVAGIEPGSVRADEANSATLASDALDAFDQRPILDELVEAGVLLARTQVGVNAPLGGFGPLIRTHAVEPLLADAAMSARVGIARGGSGFIQQVGPDGSIRFIQAPPTVDPIDRVGQVDKLVGELEDAEKYLLDRAEYEAELATWAAEIAEKEKELEDDFKKAKKARDKKVKEAEEDGEELKEKRYREDKRPKEPRFDAEKAALARVVDGEVPLVIHAERALEIRDLLRLTEKFGRLRMIIAGGTAALACADDLAARDVPVI